MPKVKTAICFSLASLLLLLTLPAWGASDKTKDEETIRNATTVLQAMVGSKDVPASTVAKAECIIILPSVKKFAVGIGGTGGRGPMVCREGAEFTGKWGPPAMYSIGGASAGFQVGGTAKDYIILVMAASAANKLLDGKVKVGSDATAAAGSGASASTGSADMLTYSRTSGLFAGVSLDGASLSPDSDANSRLYDKSVTAREIVSGKDVKPTPAGQQLTSLLNSKGKM
ncbi:MAG: lipid-binding SYLF domain-containing protein [Candidatus Korobacteraceae bacterium]|jgi:lipid-binding SYLF domain-containing protein